MKTMMRLMVSVLMVIALAVLVGTAQAAPPGADSVTWRTNIVVVVTNGAPQTLYTVPAGQVLLSLRMQVLSNGVYMAYVAGAVTNFPAAERWLFGSADQPHTRGFPLYDNATLYANSTGTCMSAVQIDARGK